MIKLMLCTWTTTSHLGVLALSTPKVSGAGGWAGKGFPVNRQGNVPLTP